MLLYATNTHVKSNTTLYELYKITYPTKCVLTVPIIWAEVTQASDVRWCLCFLHSLKIWERDWRLDKMAYRLTFSLQSRELYFSSCKLVGKNLRIVLTFFHQSTHTFCWVLFNLLLPSYVASNAALWQLGLMEAWPEQSHVLLLP